MATAQDYFDNILTRLTGVIQKIFNKVWRKQFSDTPVISLTFHNNFYYRLLAMYQLLKRVKNLTA